MKKIMVKILGIVISVLLILQNYVVYATSSKSQLQNEQSDIDQQIKALQKEQEEIQANKSSAMKAVEELIYQISDVETEISDLETQISDLKAQITSRENDIQQKEAEYNKQEELLDARMLALYKSGDNSYLEVLLTSSSMYDFLSKYYMAQELMECDKDFMAEVTKEKEDLQAQKVQLEEDKKTLDTSLSEQKAKQKSLKSLKSEKEAYASKLTADEQENQKEIEEFEKEKQNIEAKLRKIAEEEAKKNNTNLSGNPSACGYISPIPGTSKSSITCGFYGYSGHGGADFGGHYGEKVVAVKAGTVEISTAKSGSIKNYDSNGNVRGSYSSYGEYIVINHHDGTMTLYAHGLPGSRLVKAGDEVKQGQQIMSVGNTGNVLPRPSAGNYRRGAHLHFEVRVNGARVNPAPYLP